MASKAVNRPTDIKQKENDVNRKLQFYGIISGKQFRSQSPQRAALLTLHAQHSKQARCHL